MTTHAPNVVPGLGAAVWLSARVRPVIEIALAVALAYVAASLVWVGAPPVVASGAGPAATTPAALEASRPVDMSVVTAFNPFHVDAPGGPAAPETFDDAPETTLNLQLDGIRAAVGDAPSVAFIKGSDGVTKRYAEGDAISPGVRVRRIFEDRIILNRNGTDESLLHRRDDEPFGGGATAAAQPASRPATAPASPPRAAMPAARGSTPLSAEALMQQVAFSPVREDGELIGLAVRPRGDGQLFARTGLSPGDVVVEINGVTPGNGAAFLSVLDDLEDLNALSIAVERDGARNTFTIPLR